MNVNKDYSFTVTDISNVIYDGDNFKLNKIGDYTIIISEIQKEIEGISNQINFNN